MRAEIGMHSLFHEFDPATPLGERWKALAQAKLEELDRLVSHAAQMR